MLIDLAMKMKAVKNNFIFLGNSKIKQNKELAEIDELFKLREKINKQIFAREDNTKRL
jgi:hypothetical protein